MKFIKTTKSLQITHTLSAVDESFQKLRKSEQRCFLLESKSISHVYGRMSLIGVDPVIEIRGKNNKFEIKCLNDRGMQYLKEIFDDDFGICESFERGDGFTKGIIKQENGKNISEAERTHRKNISAVIRMFLEKFKINKKEFVGLYGAFSYDFIRLFENLPDILPENDIDDFRLFVYDSFVFFDHLKEKAEVMAYRGDEEESSIAVDAIMARLADEDFTSSEYSITNSSFEIEKDDYEEMVRNAKELAKQGELFEVVYSNTLHADFEGDPFALYLKYSEVNPSPYLFYFDFRDEQLIGASPEMMVRCENGQVSLRPISGTARRGNDPIEDHENMMSLLQSEKERAELDMLIDLGRNDVSRICKPGVRITDYRFVEKYSKVMHTVAHVTGELKQGFSAFDALIASLNAGTLTGAPKVAAMCEIEQCEKSRRGYYGGVIGYLTFSGDMDTGIIIRAAHVKDGHLSFRVGATLLYDSEPENEYQETLNKAEAFLKTFEV